MAGEFAVSQAWEKASAASFGGEPGTPIAAPIMKAIRATTARGSARVTSRLRRSTSEGRLFTDRKM